VDALEQIKAVYDDQKAEINGREYEFKSFTHKQRRKVYAYYTSIVHEIENDSMAFLGTDAWESIEELICNHVVYDGVQLSKREDHWDRYAGDYILFIMTAMPVISYPFLAGSHTN
jgi:hypothetical protein